MNDRVRLKKESKKKGKRPELGLVFGRPLAEVVELQNDGTPVPKIVRETIAWLENHGGPWSLLFELSTRDVFLIV